MSKLTKIDKLERSDERFAPFFSLKGSQTPPGKIVIESEKVLHKALDSNQKFDFILCTPEAYEANKNLYIDVDVYLVDKSELQSTVGFNLHHGQFAIINEPRTYELSELKPPYLVLNGLTNAENIGAIARNCSGFGVESVIIDERCPSPFLRRSSRVSMGCVFNLKYHKTNNLLATLNELKKDKIQIAATAIRDHSIEIDQFKFHKDLALIIGSEGYGVDQEIIENSDEVIYIPMKNNTEALNAACSSAIFLSYLNTSIKV